MDRKSIIQKFKTLNLWSRGEERAPHKPLLVLYTIGKLLQGESRLLPYSEIDENLGNLLREFGPKRNTRTEFPFWRLQNDGVWEITDADKIGQTSSGDALKSDLVRYDVSGGFLEDIAHQLQNDSTLSFEIIHSLLDAHFPSSLHEDILQAVGIEFPLPIFNQQRSNISFRANILRAYEYKCAVCSFDVRLGNSPIALEASHIRWHQANGPDEVVNGLALCSLHHRLFDRGAFTLSQQLEILVSDDVHGSVGFEEWLMRFHGETISFPQRRSYYPHESFIDWHIREVFQGDYREL
jgi:putative restriction endonuclease